MSKPAINNLMTGHNDCCGQMIKEGDQVVTANGTGTVRWVCSAWRILYEDGHIEPLNAYGKDRIRKVQQ